jgi:methyl-accepting chemotaxis protein
MAKMPGIVDAFYDHVAKIPGAMAIVQAAGSTIERLKKTNPDYFATMFTGNFDEAYFQSRVKIGMIHAKIKLDPLSFYAAMSTYYDTITPIIVQKYKLNPCKLSAALAAFNKAMNLDQALIMDAYLEYGYLGDLGTLVERSSDVALSLATTSKELSEASEQTGQAINEIASAVMHIAEAAGSQAKIAMEASTTTGQLANSGREINTGAQKQGTALETAQSAIESVMQSIDLMNQQASAWTQIKERLSAMQRVKEAVQTTSEKVAEMNESSDQIGRIVQTIEDIAAQTNLLALNAAIEAARAGDAGRGFAVVAEEVRKLAEHSASAAKDITNLIGAVQQGSHEAGEAMKVTLEDMDLASAVTKEAADCLESIATSAESAVASSSQVKSAMNLVEEVSVSNSSLSSGIALGIDGLNAHIDQVAAMSEENSASTEEMSAGTEEVSAQVQQLIAGVQELDKRVANLVDANKDADEMLSAAKKKLYSAGHPAKPSDSSYSKAA